MEHIIAKLLNDFENGKMNRRQLIQALALAAANHAAVASERWRSIAWVWPIFSQPSAITDASDAESTALRYSISAWR